MNRRWMRTLMLAALCAAATLAVALPAARVEVAHAQAGTVLADAQKLYDEAKFDDAIAMLRQALNTGGVTGGDVIGARELLARCLVKAGNRVEAQQVFRAILDRDPGYRPDALRVPPDEVDVYNLARKDFDEERRREGLRVPASVGGFFGMGSGNNSDFGEVVKAGGGDENYDSKPMFGGSVRFPIQPKLSLDLELGRFRATNADSSPPTTRANYEITAMPLAVSLYYAAWSHPKWRVNLFAGGGPLLVATSTIKLPFFTIPISISDQKTGFYGHAGFEGEYMIADRVAVSGRLLGRVANASGLFSGSTLNLYSSPPLIPGKKLADREVNFSGFGASLGVRAYIGY